MQSKVSPTVLPFPPQLGSHRVFRPAGEAFACPTLPLRPRLPPALAVRHPAHRRDAERDMLLDRHAQLLRAQHQVLAAERPARRPYPSSCASPNPASTSKIVFPGFTSEHAVRKPAISSQAKSAWSSGVSRATPV